MALLTMAALAAVLVLLVFGWRRHARSTRTASLDDVDRAQAALAAAVLDQWRTEIRRRGLDEPVALVPRWRITTVAAGRPEARAEPVEGMIGGIRELVGRSIMIVGPPGAGKTALAMRIVYALAAGRDAADPVPVLVPAAGWDARAEHLHDWLARQIVTGYPAMARFGPRTVGALVTQGGALPVVDGLDALPDPVGRAVIRATQGVGPLILTSRDTATAQMIGRVLLDGGGAVVDPVPLTAENAGAYLRHHLGGEATGGWLDLLSTIDKSPDGPVASALSFPPALWLLRRVYLDAGRDPVGLGDPARFPTAAAIADHLLDHLVPELISTNPPSRGGIDQPFRPRRAWKPDKAARWLGFLASHLHASGARELAWWRLSRAVPGRVWHAFWSAPRTPATTSLRLRGRVGLLVRSLRFGLVFALVIMVTEATADLIGAMFDATGRGGVAMALRLAGIFGVMFGAAGIFLGLMRWSTVPATGDEPHPPPESLRRDRPVAFVSTTVGGLGAGLVAGVAVGIAEWQGGELADGLVPLFVLPVIGVVGGPAIGLLLFALGATASGTYQAAVRALALRRRLPRRLMRFLDDAQRLGLLHHTGAVYHFRYPRLQDRLASTYPGRSRTPDR